MARASVQGDPLGCLDDGRPSSFRGAAQRLLRIRRLNSAVSQSVTFLLAATYYKIIHQQVSSARRISQVAGAHRKGLAGAHRKESNLRSVER
ncbi:unnamed protein product [Urochloa humidicola]